MRHKRADQPAGSRTGKHRSERPQPQVRPWTQRRPRRWRLVPITTVAGIILAYAGVMAADETTSADGHPATGTLTTDQPAKLGTGVVDPSVKPYLDPKQLAAVSVGPADVSAPVRMVLASSQVTTALDASGIPEVALSAYQRAATVMAASDRSCHLPWQLVAAIGRVESNHGRFGGSMLRANGDGTRPIRGLPLDGRANVALVRDTDGGKLDGDPNFDRAVGPMQFIPSTWAVYGVDANGDGKRDPNNIFDASLATAVFLCAGGGDLANSADAAAAVRRYNNADQYVRVVLALEASYEHGDASTLPLSTDVSAPAPVGGDDTGTPPPAVSAPTGHHSVVKAKARSGQRSGPSTRRHHTSSGTAHSLPAAHASAHASGQASSLTPSQTRSQTPTTHTTSQPTQAPKAPASSAPTTAPATSAPTAPPTVTPSSPATQAPTAEPTSPAPTTPAPTGTSTTQPTPSDAPSQIPSPTPKKDQTANVGWAPAMREVVVKLLTHPGPTPHSAATSHVPAEHHTSAGRPPRSRD